MFSFKKIVYIALLLVIGFSLVAPLASVTAQNLSLAPGVLTPVQPETVNNNTITRTIGFIANIVIGIIAAISVFYIIYGAWEWLNNNPEKGQKTLVNAVIGLIIAILAFFIVQFAVGAGSFLERTLR